MPRIKETAPVRMGKILEVFSGLEDGSDIRKGGIFY
jgi:hypothetical protein